MKQQGIRVQAVRSFACAAFAGEPLLPQDIDFAVRKDETSAAPAQK